MTPAPTQWDDIQRRKAWLQEALALHLPSGAQASDLPDGTLSQAAKEVLAEWKWARWYCQQDVSCGRCDTTDEVECFLLHGMLLE